MLGPSQSNNIAYPQYCLLHLCCFSGIKRRLLPSFCLLEYFSSGEDKVRIYPYEMLQYTFLDCCIPILSLLCSTFILYHIMYGQIISCYLKLTVSLSKNGLRVQINNKIYRHLSDCTCFMQVLFVFQARMYTLVAGILPFIPPVPHIV